MGKSIRYPYTSTFSFLKSTVSRTTDNPYPVTCQCILLLRSHYYFSVSPRFFSTSRNYLSGLNRLLSSLRKFCVSCDTYHCDSISSRTLQRSFDSTRDTHLVVLVPSSTTETLSFSNSILN